MDKYQLYVHLAYYDIYIVTENIKRLAYCLIIYSIEVQKKSNIWLSIEWII